MSNLLLLIAASLAADDLPGSYLPPMRNGVYKFHTYLSGGMQIAVVKGNVECVNREELGTKLTAYWRWTNGRLRFHAITPREEPWHGQYLAYDPTGKDPKLRLEKEPIEGTLWELRGHPKEHAAAILVVAVEGKARGMGLGTMLDRKYSQRTIEGKTYRANDAGLWPTGGIAMEFRSASPFEKEEKPADDPKK